VARAMVAEGVPSVSLAIVRHGSIVYEQAYGLARVTSPQPATTATRYHIGSVSKQFTAAALLLLAEDGKLSLDDKVAHWFPDLPHAADVSVRQLLSMTAGYTDFWPQDFVFDDMTRPIAPMDIARRWAAQPLDFEPGTGNLYSNTDYVIAGLIAEKVSGKPLFELMRERIFSPLGMTSVIDVEHGGRNADEAESLERYGLGPLRPSVPEAHGWLFALGQLSMTPHDLALWDQSQIRRSLLKPASYRAMQADTLLADGHAAGYGLGLAVGVVGGHRRVGHSGAVSGFETFNRVYPDDGLAIVATTNLAFGVSNAARRVVMALDDVMRVPAVDLLEPAALSRAKSLFAAAQSGRLANEAMSAHARLFLTSQVLSDMATSLAPLGAPTEFSADGVADARGGMNNRNYRVVCGDTVLALTMRVLADGSLEEFLVERSR